MSPAAHDEIMSIVLGLSHFIALASADALLEFGRLSESGQAAGTTYQLLLTLAGSVLSEDPGLYSALQTYLPGAVAAEKAFIERAQAWLKMIENRDRNQFEQRMTGVREDFRQAIPGFEHSYHEMYRLIDRPDPPAE
jgi:prephenate dehydrogenase